MPQEVRAGRFPAIRHFTRKSPPSANLAGFFLVQRCLPAPRPEHGNHRHHGQDVRLHHDPAAGAASASPGNAPVWFRALSQRRKVSVGLMDSSPISTNSVILT